MDILSLGNKIKLKRKEKNMKLKDLAGDRITPGQISLIESGKSNPSEDLLWYLAQKLDITVDYLLETEQKQAEDVCGFYSDIVEAALEIGNYSRAEENIEKGGHYAKEYKIHLYEGIFIYRKAQLEFYRENYTVAQQKALESLVIFLKIHDEFQAMNSFILLGEIACKEGDYKLGFNYFKEAENSFNKSNAVQRILRIKIYYNLAKCLSMLSEPSKAIDYALIVKEEIELVEDYDLYADTLMVLAFSFVQEDNKIEALKCAEKARIVASQKKDILSIGEMEESIGMFLIDSLSIEEGVGHLTRAYEIKQTIRSNDTDETMMKVILGLIKSEDYDKALKGIEYLEGKSDLKLDLKIELIEYKYVISKNLHSNNESEKEILKLISLIPAIENREKLEYYLMLIGSFYKDIGENDIALKYFEKAFESKKRAI